MPSAMNALNISAVLFQEGEWWTAQCLEYDIAAQAKTLPELRHELERVIVSHLVVSDELGRPAFANIGPAPQRFWKMYASSNMRLETEEMPFRLPTDHLSPSIIPRLRIAEKQLEVA
jgi:hypothetical protein